MYRILQAFNLIITAELVNKNISSCFRPGVDASYLKFLNSSHCLGLSDIVLFLYKWDTNYHQVLNYFRLVL